MTIASLKARGVTGVVVICDDCLRPDAAMAWDRISLPDETAFLDIVKLKTFRCDMCGLPGRLMPDWSGMYERWKRTVARGNSE